MNMLNRVTLVGRITKDPELRQAGQYNCVNFTLAVNRNFKKEGQSDADFINCVAWNAQANFLGNYIKQGYLLSVEGRLQTRSYDGQNGKVYVTEVYVESVENLTPKQANQNTEAYQSQPKPTQTYQQNQYNQSNYQQNQYKQNYQQQNFLDAPINNGFASDDNPFY